MDEVMVVRHRVLSQGISRRKVAKELGISRNTVKRYVKGAPVGERREAKRPTPVFDSVRVRMEALLVESAAWTSGKQRLTAMQLHRMLRAEGFEVGDTLVKTYVREWKRRRAEVFVPLQYRPGDLGLVDFFEVVVDVAGKRVKAHMFVMRLMASSRDFASVPVVFASGIIADATIFPDSPLTASQSAHQVAPGGKKNSNPPAALSIRDARYRLAENGRSILHATHDVGSPLNTASPHDWNVQAGTGIGDGEIVELDLRAVNRLQDKFLGSDTVAFSTEVDSVTPFSPGRVRIASFSATIDTDCLDFSEGNVAEVLIKGRQISGTQWSDDAAEFVIEIERHPA